MYNKSKLDILCEYIHQLTCRDDIFFTTIFNTTQNSQLLLQSILDTDVTIEKTYRIPDIIVPNLVGHRIILSFDVVHNMLYVLTLVPTGIDIRTYYELIKLQVSVSIEKYYPEYQDMIVNYVCFTDLENETISHIELANTNDAISIFNIGYNNEDNVFGKIVKDMNESDENQTVSILSDVIKTYKTKEMLFVAKYFANSSRYKYFSKTIDLMNKEWNDERIAEKKYLFDGELIKMRQIFDKAPDVAHASPVAKTEVKTVEIYGSKAKVTQFNTKDINQIIRYYLQEAELKLQQKKKKK